MSIFDCPRRNNKSWAGDVERLFLVLVAFSLLFAAACSNETPSAESTAQEHIQIPEATGESPSNPSDGSDTPTSHPEKSHTDKVLEHEQQISLCMKNAGFEYHAALPAFAVAEQAIINAIDAGGDKTDVDVAQILESHPPDPNMAALNAMSEAEAETFLVQKESCFSTTYQEVWGIDPAAIVAENEDEWAKTEEEIAADPRTHQAADDFARCMLEAGYDFKTTDDLVEYEIKRTREVIHEITGGDPNIPAKNTHPLWQAFEAEWETLESEIGPCKKAYIDTNNAIFNEHYGYDTDTQGDSSNNKAPMVTAEDLFGDREPKVQQIRSDFSVASFLEEFQDFKKGSDISALMPLCQDSMKALLSFTDNEPEFAVLESPDAKQRVLITTTQTTAGSTVVNALDSVLQKCSAQTWNPSVKRDNIRFSTLEGANASEPFRIKEGPHDPLTGVTSLSIVHSETHLVLWVTDGSPDTTHAETTSLDSDLSHRIFKSFGLK